MVKARLASAIAAVVVAACAMAMVLAAVYNIHPQKVVLASGLSTKASNEDLNSYFASMDHDVKKAQQLASRHLERENEKVRVESKRNGNNQGLSSLSSPSQPQHGFKAKVANAKLSGYFEKQALAIKKQAQKNAEQRKINEPSRLSAMAANDDLNSYFDSLNVATTKEGKLDRLSKQVASLSKDFEKVVDPVEELKEKQKSTMSTIQNLDKQSKELMRASKMREGQASRAEDAARKAAESAEEAAHAKPASVVVKQVERVVPKHIGNPAVKVYGLPPGWKSYMDRRTRYAYFYDDHSGESTWKNPKGSPVAVKGLPYGWEALKEHGGKQAGRVYYVDRRSGLSTFSDPRLKAGAEVLNLIEAKNHFRDVRMASAEKTAKLAALADDHGVYDHATPRSQWADQTWMRFLAPARDVGGPMGGMTNDEALRRGLDAAAHPVLARAASSQY